MRITLDRHIKQFTFLIFGASGLFGVGFFGVELFGSGVEGVDGASFSLIMVKPTSILPS